MGNNIKLDLFQMISQQVRRMLFYIGYYLYTEYSVGAHYL